MRLPATDPRRPTVFTVAAEASFADAIAVELVRRYAGDPLGLASGRILLPNARAVRTLTEAFVRVSGNGLLLPRLIPVGDPALGDRIGGAFEQPGGDPIPPAVDPLTRQAELALAIQARQETGPAECWRLAAELARTLDQLLVEEVPVASVRDLRPEDADLAEHHARALQSLAILLDDWPRRLAALGRIDLAERRNLLLRATARRWKADPPPGFTVAAGITTAAPAIAELLGVIARMPQGTVILPGLAPTAHLPDDQWHALGRVGEEGLKPEPTHPQFHLKLLLERISVNRAEVDPWPTARDPSLARLNLARRSRVAARALTAAAFSHEWSALPFRERSLTGVRLAILPDPAAEAMAIALALREAIVGPGRRAALVTPDRLLARRVAAQLHRWGITADDSAGTPLSMMPPGSLLLGMIEAAADHLSPVALLALLGHPLVGEGEARGPLRDDVRTLDLALRGPRPPAGIEGLDRAIAAARIKGAADAWQRLRPRGQAVAGLLETPLSLAILAGRLRDAAANLAGDGLWSGPAGRAAADLLAGLEASPSCAAFGLREEDAAPLLRDLLDGQAIRPPFGQHPRIQILGLLEARLLRTDLMVLGGLNEGSWPAAPSPDPWLAPRIRRALGLPGSETRIGLAAHDFAGLLCAPQVLLTRSRRDARSPTVSSRLLLRLQALTGGLPRHRRLERLALALDEPAGRETPVNRPRPRPPVAERPRLIRVTDLDRLKADPYSFYAKAMLKLMPLSPLGAEQDAKWRGILVHRLFETWHEEDQCAPAQLLPRARTLLDAEDIHPLLRSLWGPRLLDAIARLAEIETTNQAAGRRPAGAEVDGETVIGGIRLIGRADRIDRLPDGSLAILDYKTGKPPAKKQVEAGFALQLGLLGIIAEAGGFKDLKGTPGALEYWSLAKQDKGDARGYVQAMPGPGGLLDAAQEHFCTAAARWLTGDEPFTAKLQPRFAVGDDYDQLMRLEEWLGRD